MGVCRLFNPKSTLVVPCPRRGGSPGIFRRVMAPKLFWGWGWGEVLQPQPESEMWVFNYTIKCTIRHNYQCSEPETAHNRRVIYCSLCLYYSARALMMPGCLHTALLPWRQARHHHAGLTNGVPVLGPWIVSEASAGSPGVKGLAGLGRKAGYLLAL